MSKTIIQELKRHAPFTFAGAITGIVIMVMFHNLPSKVSYNIFYIFHPAHVALSALVTASMYKFHTKAKLLGLLLIGYLGSVGIATLSDSLIPYMGEALLDLPNRGVHIGFIEEWWLVNPLAIIGIAVAYLKPSTKFPHFGHVLLSTWASMFHIMMALGHAPGIFEYIVILFFLFIAVWLPCCISDIVFPIAFAEKNNKKLLHQCEHKSCALSDRRF